MTIKQELVGMDIESLVLSPLTEK